MDKSTRYSIVALVVLFVSSAMIGSYVYFANQNQVSASTEVPTEPISSSVPLKVGWNYFTNGPKSVTLDSMIIGINGSLISIDEAKSRGILSKIVRTDDKAVLGESVSRIKPNEDFAILGVDISVAPAVFIEGIN